MSSIPLPELDLRPMQQTDPIGEYGKALALKSLMGQQQLQQGQAQLQQGQIAIQQQDLKDRQAVTSAMQQAYQNWDGKDYRQLYQQVPNLALKNGASSNAIFQIQQHV